MNYLEKIRKFKNSKEKSSLTNAMRVNNNACIKHEDRFFKSNSIQSGLVTAYFLSIPYNSILQLNYEGLTLRLLTLRLALRLACVIPNQP